MLRVVAVGAVLALVGVLAPAAGPAQAAAALDVFSFSSYGDYPSGGASYLVTPTTGEVQLQGQTGREIWGTGWGAAAGPGFTFSLVPKVGGDGSVAVGTYRHVGTTSSETAIGFSLRVGYQSCGSADSTVVVHDIATDGAGLVTRLWLDFVVPCAPMAGVGEFRYGVAGTAGDLTLGTRAALFQDTFLGASSRIMPMAVINTTSAPLSITDVSVTGPDAASFAIASTTCGAAIAVGASCSVGIRFTPSSGGARAASLTFADDGPVGTHQVALSGTGLDGSTAIYLRPDPGMTYTDGLPVDRTPADSGFHYVGGASWVSLVGSRGGETSVAVDVRTGSDTPFEAGRTYTVSDSVPGDAGLDITLGQSRYCAMTEGTVTVLQSDPGTGPPTRFAATFSGRCASGAPLLHGWISYRASSPLLPTPGAGPTTMTLIAPATAARGARIAVGGRVLATGVGVPGVSVVVSRTTWAGTTELAALTTASDGTFSVQDQPGASGAVSYTAEFAGSGGWQASTASASVAVAKVASVVGLRASASTMPYGRAVGLSVTLGPTLHSRQVTVYFNDLNGDRLWHVLWRGDVPFGTTVHLSKRLYRSVKFTAVFAGDAETLASSARASATARALLTTMLHRYYTTSRGVRLYHASAIPQIETLVLPKRSDEGCLVFTAQVYRSGVWRTAATSKCIGVSRLSQAYAYLFTVSGARQRVGSLFRIHAVLAKDWINAASVSNWAYLKFTA